MAKPPVNCPECYEADFMFAHNRPVLTVRDICLAFSISDEQVRALNEAGLIVGAGVNDQVNPQRIHLRFERWSVVAWRLEALAEQGHDLPIKETPLITYWRTELQKRKNPKRKTEEAKA